ncbi:MAG TPA: FecR domain-containing protein [Polyangiaceae bacterium]|nr:FecR domain-containing protein [Polyangiaceae bacterium]
MSNASPVVAILQPTGSGVQLLTPNGSEPLHSGSPLPLGGRLIANPAGGASLQLSTGTQIGIGQDANLTFSDAGPTERFELSAGSIHAHVAKLGPGERFIVATPDAEIEVRGTQFVLRVVAPDPQCGAGSRTRVVVSEGVVEVRAQGESALIHPGEEWPSHCTDGAALAAASANPNPAPSTISQTSRAPKLSASMASPGPVAAGPARAAESSSLAEQNDLFAAGMAARRSGDARIAVAKFQELLTRYPASALAESAFAETMRAESTLNHSEAQRLARNYLQRFPDGFARRDAQAILSSP